MKKYMKTVQVEVSEAVAAGLEKAGLEKAGSMADGVFNYTLTYEQLVEILELVEEKAVYAWNNSPR